MALLTLKVADPCFKSKKIYDTIELSVSPAPGQLVLLLPLEHISQQVMFGYC